jgi:DNA-binding PadR family transcriptional regulator
MARKRKVDNLLALAVLATVQQRPMHRYEMASIMRARGKDQDMNLKWGSLYTVVQNMEKHGFLETIGSTRQGARPERTIYRITEAGKQELVEWTRELISDPQPERPKFAAGLSVLAVLPPQEVIALFQTRLGRLEESISAQRAAIAEHTKDLPRLFLIENEYSLAILEAEAAWVRSLHDELTSGTYPDLAGWQAWHTTGEIPGEIAELAGRERPQTGQGQF